jgi:hypothetical protein
MMIGLAADRILMMKRQFHSTTTTTTTSSLLDPQGKGSTKDKTNGISMPQLQACICACFVNGQDFFGSPKTQSGWVRRERQMILLVVVVVTDLNGRIAGTRAQQHS